MRAIIEGTAKEIADLVLQLQGQQGSSQEGGEIVAPDKTVVLDLVEQERQKWMRFELITDDAAQVKEFQDVMKRIKPTRRELAVIVASLRVRPGFSLEDFDT